MARNFAFTLKTPMIVLTLTVLATHSRAALVDIYVIKETLLS